MKKLLPLIAAVIAGFAAKAIADDNSAQHAFTDDELLAMASNKYASSELPLGDKHYVTDAPRKGYIYLCQIMNGGGGAEGQAKWIHGETWDPSKKISVQGQVSWNNAEFSNTVEGNWRMLTGNGLPLNHTTGNFPVSSSDPAYSYDRNPNSIKLQTLHEMLPINPTYSDTPFCMGGEAGVMLTGVPLFNGFDAGMRDAAAHEVQDSCGGHPQRSGQYHYHSLSPCMRDIGVKTVLGYALDGFPITGPKVAPDKYLTTENLDECHGITSEIVENGEKKITYHYVMTQDFPYSVSCFRSQPTRIGPSDHTGARNIINSDNHFAGQPPPPPPPEAVMACDGKHRGSPCQFMTPHGDSISGGCKSPPGFPLACMPVRPLFQ